MNFLKKHLFKSIIPLILDLLFIVLVAPFLKLENFILLIAKEGSLLIYFYIIAIDLLFVFAFIVRRELFLIRIITSNLLFVLFILLNFFYKDQNIFESALFIFIVYDAVFSLYLIFTALFNLNSRPKLPPNRFSTTSKYISRIFYVIIILLLALNSFLQFYFIGSTFFVWAMVIGSDLFIYYSLLIISSFIVFNPLHKANREFQRHKTYLKYLHDLDRIDTTRLHSETINTINLHRLITYVLFDFKMAKNIIFLVKLPKSYEVKMMYYFIIFLYHVKNLDYEELLKDKALYLKRTKSLKYIVKDFYSILEHSESKKPFYNKKYKHFIKSKVAQLALDLKETMKGSQLYET